MADGDSSTLKSAEAAFDPEALLAKYRAERDKRLRGDANSQFIKVAEKFPHFLADPHADPDFKRKPLTDEVEVVVIGGGYSGLLASVRLRQAGFDNVRIIEKGAEFGGTWYWNRYPGVACDVESYIYLPLLEELGFMPTRKYAPGPEILEHCRAIARQFDLYKDVCFQTTVNELRWNDETSRWGITTNRGDDMQARFVVMANAASFDSPKLPGIPGIETFKGHTFHTSRWDYGYTGGDSSGGLTGLAGKKVGIIGTGATAVQAIPHLAAGADHLYVFQRTPSSVDVRNDRPTDPAWAASLEPGWQEKRILNFTSLTTGVPVEEDLIQDGWTDIIGNINLIAQRKAAAGEPVDDPAALMQLADFTKMEQIRARVDQVVGKADYAETLKPYYNQFCKRPCFHDDYLPAFNSPNVTLVDTAGKGVERVDESGVWVDGQHYEVDCLIFATGFEVGMSFDRRFGYTVYGRGGVTLSQKWKDGAATLHGQHTSGFPNCFILSPVQGTLSFNFTHVCEEQSRHVAYVMTKAREVGAKVIEATAEGEAGWTDEVKRVALNREAFMKECTPGYYNYEGDTSMVNVRNGPYGAGPMAYFAKLQAWRAQGDMPGLKLG
jgi:cation diffusion facilitator CzcD-associated flavoprotein CzcO